MERGPSETCSSLVGQEIPGTAWNPEVPDQKPTCSPYPEPEELSPHHAISPA